MSTQTGSLDLKAIKQAYIKTVAKAQPIYKRTNTDSKPNPPTSTVTANTDQGTSGNWTIMHMARLCSTNFAYKYLWTCNQLLAPDGTFLGTTDVVADKGTTVINGDEIATGTIAAARLNIADTITAINDNGTTTINGGKITTGSIAIGKLDTTAQNTISNAANTANSYITTITGTTGISVHNANDTNNFVNINSNGMKVYKGGTSDSNVVASFGDTARVGREANGYARTLLSTGGMQVVQRESNGTDIELANLGYGLGNAILGTEETAPYFTLGARNTTTTEYSSSATYSIGDLCVYDNKIHVCIANIDTPEAWNSEHWEFYRGNNSVAEGYHTTASGYCSHSEGHLTTATWYASHAEGHLTKALYLGNHAEGVQTIAYGVGDGGAHAEGYLTKAHGDNSHAEGHITKAHGDYSHAEGTMSEAIENGSHAEGYYSYAGGLYSHAEGCSTSANGAYSHAEGWATVASGGASHAKNNRTIASKLAQTAIGSCNVEDTSSTTTHPSRQTAYGTYALIIGNGYTEGPIPTVHRSNALTVDWSGNVNIANGAKYKINGVNLSASDVDAVPTTRTVNSKVLSSDIVLVPSDLGLVDYITSKGTSGDWYYTKYASGKIDAWGMVQKSSITYSASGNLYRSTDLAIAIPSGIFTAAPTFVETFIHSSNAVIVSVMATPVSSTSLTAQIWKVNSTSNACTFRFHCVYYPSDY